MGVFGRPLLRRSAISFLLQTNELWQSRVADVAAGHGCPRPAATCNRSQKVTTSSDMVVLLQRSVEEVEVALLRDRVDVFVCVPKREVVQNVQ